MQEGYKQIIDRIVEESKKVNTRPLENENLYKSVFSLNNKMIQQPITQKPSNATKKKKIPIVKNDRLPDKFVDFDNEINWLL